MSSVVVIGAGEGAVFTVLEARLVGLVRGGVRGVVSLYGGRGIRGLFIFNSVLAGRFGSGDSISLIISFGGGRMRSCFSGCFSFGCSLRRLLNERVSLLRRRAVGGPCLGGGISTAGALVCK